MCDPFTVAFQGPADDLIAKLKIEVEQNHGTFQGDVNQGHFEVPIPLPLAKHVIGDYEIAAPQQITITISQKPALISCGQIEDFIKGHI